MTDAFPSFTQTYHVVAGKESRVTQTINGEELQGQEQAIAALAQQASIVDPKVLLADEQQSEINPITGVPKKLNKYRVHKDPDIFLIPSFVSDAEIEHLLALAEELWTPSTVGRGAYKREPADDPSESGLTNKQSQNRTSFSCKLKYSQSASVENIEHRIATIAGMDVVHLEPLNLVRYHPGQFFNKHHDGRFRPKTVFLYLNDLPDGDDGETYFPELGLKFTPCKGCAILWSNSHEDQEDMRMVHQGLPPRTSIKYGVNCFFNRKPVRKYEAAQVALSHDEANAEKWNTVSPEALAQGKIQQPGELLAFKIFHRPAIIVVPSFLSADEAKALITLVTEKHEADLDLCDVIEERCAHLAGLPLFQMQPMTVSTSDSSITPDGVFFENAEDGSYRRKFGCKTICIFLNDVAEGGELRFPRLGLQVLPRAGAAVMWSLAQPDGLDDLRAVHQGRSPKQGLRYTATCIFRQSAVRQSLAPDR